MPNSPSPKTYKTPARKLFRFFERSRNRWKAKHQAGKVNLKRLENRVRFLSQSKDHWKSRVAALEAEVARLQAREHDLEQALETVQKKQAPPP